MQQHAERPAHLTEHLQYAVYNIMVLGGDVRLASDGGNSWHNGSLLRENRKYKQSIGNVNAIVPQCGRVCTVICHTRKGSLCIQHTRARETTAPDDAAEKICFILSIPHLCHLTSP